jgi:hypothetical protein
MAVRLSALRDGRSFTPQIHSCHRQSKFQGTVRPGLEPVTFGLMAQCLSNSAIACPGHSVEQNYLNKDERIEVTPHLT